MSKIAVLLLVAWSTMTLTKGNAPSPTLGTTEGAQDVLPAYKFNPGVTTNPFTNGTGSEIITPAQDGGLVEAGNWIVNDLARQVVLNSISDYTSFTLGMDQLYTSAVYTSAACISVNFTASSPVSINVISTTNIQQTTYSNTSLMSTNDVLPGKAVLGSTFVGARTASFTVALDPSQAYRLAVNNATAGGTFVIYTLRVSPTNSTDCRIATYATPLVPAAAIMPAPSPGAGTIAELNPVRGLQLRQLGAGSQIPLVAFTGASCIAFGASLGNQSNSTNSSSNLDISSPGHAASANVSASVFIIDSQNLDLYFQTQLGNIQALSGCLLNASAPGPCFSNIGGLDNSSVYYLWAASGGSEGAAFLASYAALPAGSCASIFQASASGTSATPPSTSTSASYGEGKSLDDELPGGAVGGIIVAGAVACAGLVSIAAYLTGWWQPARSSNRSYLQHDGHYHPMHSPSPHNSATPAAKEFATAHSGFNGTSQTNSTTALLTIPSGDEMPTADAGTGGPGSTAPV